VENRKREVYGDNYVDDYPPYWNAGKFAHHERLNASAITYGAGLALAITFVSLMLGFLWAQVVESVTLNYSFLVDLTLAGSVLFGAFKGAVRARNMGLIHGALIGIVYSIMGILILAVLAPINWLGALETILIAGFLGSIGGIAGTNYRAGRETRSWRKRTDDKPDEDYNQFTRD